MANRAEIDACQQAAIKASDEGVINFGRLMTQLKALADSLQLYAAASQDAIH